MKDGLVIPVYKWQGKNPLLLNSYRGITISPVLCKIFELILLQRLSPILQNAGSPHLLQTAYQKGVSSMDAIFATQEALLTHYCDGGKPYLCLFDLENAYDSVELPVLLQRLRSGNKWKMLETYQKLVYRFQRSSQCWWPPVRPLPCEARSKAGVSAISYSVPYGHGQARGEYDI